MATRNIYDDLFGIGSQVTSISTGGNASKGIPLTNHPNMDIGVSIIDQRKAIGESTRNTAVGYEFQQGTILPTTSWEFDVNTTNMARILWSFFQATGYQDADANNIKYFIPWGEDNACEVWLNLVRKLAVAATADSHKITGAIAESITLSSEEGQPLKASVTFRGYDMTKTGTYGAYDVGVATSSDTFTFDAKAPLLWQNATVTLGATTINIPGFSLTITNSAVSKHYDSENPVKHVLGDLTVEGSFQMPWSQTTVGGNAELNNFINGASSRMVIKWGSNDLATDADDFSIIMHIRRSAATQGGDDEIVTDVSFMGVSDAISSSRITSSTSTVAYSGTGAITGTSTAFDDDLNVGDVIYSVNAAAAGDRAPRVITAIASNTACTVYPDMAGTETGVLYKAYTTPITISFRDGVDIADM